MLSPFIILTASAAVLLGEAVDIDTNHYPPKCCPFGQVLNSTLHCVIDDTELLVPTNVFYRYPNCSRNNISVISAEYNNSVMCLDKILPSNISIIEFIRDSSKLIGLTCADNVSDYKNNNFSFYVPLVDSIKKCCPPDRKFTNYTNGCWDKTVKDDIRTVKKLIKALLNDTNNYVDITYGAPICKSDEVLVDYQIPYKQVRQLDSEGIVMRIPGHTETIILPPESICVDIYSYDDLTIIVRVCQDETVTCNIQKKPCIRKCCRDGQSMINNSRTCKKSKDLFDPKFYKNVNSGGNKLTTEVYPSIVYGMCKNVYLLEPWKNADDKTYLDAYGELHFPNLNEHSSRDYYCIEFLKSKHLKLSQLVIFSCFPDESNDEYPPESKVTSAFYIAVGTGSIISCFFLLITLIVYSCLPNLQNIHGKTVMCYIVSLLAAYICLSVNQLGSLFFLLEDEITCRAIGYATFFTFFAAFSWLHILCFDLWYTFGSVRSSFVRRKSKSRSRRFFMYNLYCWGFSAFMTSIIVATDYAAKFGFISHNWVSDIGITRCWFSYKTKGRVIFFIIPIGIQLLINLIFFILTTRHCLRVRSEISKTHNSTAKMKYDNDKEKLIMTVKLFIVTGITWGLEILSQFMDPVSKWWFFSDVTNVFQGVLIFLLFVLKEKIILGISQRFRELLPCYDNTETTQKTRFNSSTVFTTTSSECKLSSVRQK